MELDAHKSAGEGLRSSPDPASPGDMGPVDLPERAGQGSASSALLGTRLWGLKIEQVHDSDMAMGTISSQKDEDLGILGRARTVLLCSSSWPWGRRVRWACLYPHPYPTPHTMVGLLCRVSLGTRHSSSSIPIT